jgi:hypothetical protein
MQLSGHVFLCFTRSADFETNHDKEIKNFLHIECCPNTESVLIYLDCVTKDIQGASLSESLLLTPDWYVTTSPNTFQNLTFL